MVMPDRALRCQHCGAVALPIDPGWTTREVVAMLRVTERHFRRMTARLDRAHELDQPSYRQLGSSPRRHRMWSSHDVQRLQALLIRRRVTTMHDSKATSLARTA